MDDRTGNPLFALKEMHTRFNHVSIVNTSTSFWKKKKITIERGNPLCMLKERSKATAIHHWRR